MIRRLNPHGDDGPRLLVAFRRTRAQAIGHGLFVGVVSGAALVGVVLAGFAVRWAGGGHGPAYTWIWLMGGFLLVTAVCTVAGAVTGVRTGVDADDLGIHRVPALPRSFGPWPAIADIRAERRRGRTVVAIYLESGAVLRLRAPYDGRLLGHDPRFERRFFTLLNLWETHRNWRSRT